MKMLIRREIYDFKKILYSTIIIIIIFGLIDSR